MRCDRCQEQLPVGDGIDRNGQTLCLACCMQGTVSACASATKDYLEYSVIGSKLGVQSSIISTEFFSNQI